jgi:hypothetical protein
MREAEPRATSEGLMTAMTLSASGTIEKTQTHLQSGAERRSRDGGEDAMQRSRRTQDTSLGARQAKRYSLRQSSTLHYGTLQVGGRAPGEAVQLAAVLAELDAEQAEACEVTMTGAVVVAVALGGREANEHQDPTCRQNGMCQHLRGRPGRCRGRCSSPGRARGR